MTAQKTIFFAKLPNYTIEFLSYEWIINSVFSLTIFILILFIGRYFDLKNKRALTYIIGGFLIFNNVVGPLRDLSIGQWRINESLPLHLCGISSWICCIMPFVNRKLQQKLFDFVFYTGTIGGVLSVLTPQINSYDGSTYQYILYYVKHLSIAILPIFMMLHMGFSLHKKSWITTFLYMNVLLVFIMPLNFAIDANYMFLAHRPEVKNPLVIGEWPYYLLWFELILIVLLLVIFKISKLQLKRHHGYQS